MSVYLFLLPPLQSDNVIGSVLFIFEKLNDRGAEVFSLRGIVVNFFPNGELN